MARQNISSTTEHEAQNLLLMYSAGFVLSIVLTFAAYWPVSRHVNSLHGIFDHTALIMVITVLAITQLIVQLLLFLHIGQDAKPRVRLLTFLFAAFALLILVFGSFWIMAHLNYNMQSPANTDKAIMQDEGFDGSHR